MSGPNFHSYQGQDRFVLEACGHQRGGYFLDSGASNGVLGSNTKMFEEEYGWRGICIEPNDAMFAELVANRSCICLNCCLYDREGSVEFFEAAEVYGGILDEYDPSHLDFARRFVAGKSPAAVAGSTRKRARTIRSILRQWRAPQVIDYWSLDTEGSELAILRSFPFDEYRVRFLTVEHNNTAMRGQLASLLFARGFRRVAHLGIDDAYAWSGRAELMPWRSRAWSSAGRGR
jgi:FkbM family methyltransferase